MKLNEFIDTMRTMHTVEIRGHDNCQISTCTSRSRGWYPYQNMDIIDWFVDPTAHKHIVVMINDREISKNA